ncbi:MAG: hypothetical protein EOP23_16645, partial [Hyphomicrobiales bacterium]
MKKILLILIVLSPIFSFAQTDTSRAKMKEQYCMIIASPKFFSTKVNIEVDFGQPTAFFSDQRLKDESGKAMSFNTTIDALNYMGSQGWLFVNAYNLPSAPTTSTTSGSVTTTTAPQSKMYYIMRRLVPAQ